jgi:hypothetical protein
MRRTGLLVVTSITILVFIISACSGRNGSPVDVEDAVFAGVAATLTKEAWLDGVESARKTSIAGEPTKQPPEPGGEEEDPAPAATNTPEPTNTPITFTGDAPPAPTPREPWEIISTYLTDHNSTEFSSEGYTYGDDFSTNRLERPFTAEEMEYRGYLDIIRANLKITGDWVYIIIYLADKLPDSGDVRYAVELDLDENGRGDLLMQTSLPLDTGWSRDTVKIYRDVDGDVGGENPLAPDEPDPELTGYEVLIYDAGRGEAPDLAWARRNPDEMNSIQFAFKQSLVGEGGYMWGIWSDEGLKAVDYYDYNDRFSKESAGSPYPGSPLYPIRALFLVDSTCRSYFGFQPTGNEPGLCP